MQNEVRPRSCLRTTVLDENARAMPCQPVELGPNGDAYFGAKGFFRACQTAINDDFLPKNIEPKLAQFGLMKTP